MKTQREEDLEAYLEQLTKLKQNIQTGCEAQDGKAILLAAGQLVEMATSSANAASRLEGEVEDLKERLSNLPVKGLPKEVQAMVQEKILAGLTPEQALEVAQRQHTHNKRVEEEAAAAKKQSR